MTSLLLICMTSKAQIDTEFWFAAPDNYNWITTGNYFPDKPLYLRFTAYESAANIQVYQPANPSFAPIYIQVPSNGFQSIDLTPFFNVIETAPVDSIVPFGLKIVSDSPVSVYFENAGAVATAIYTLKGRNALGTEFLIPQQSEFMNSNFSPYIDKLKNSIVVLATQPNTMVKIVPSKNCEAGHMAGDTIVLFMDAGESYNVKALSVSGWAHLDGSWVFSDKPIVVTSHEEGIFITKEEHYGDQMIPNDKADTAFVFVHTDFLAPWEMVYLYAPNNNTEIYHGNNPVPIATIQRGEYYRLDMYDSAYYIHSSKPLLAYHLGLIEWTGGTDMVPGLYCHGSKKVSIYRTVMANPFNLFLKFKMFIVVKTGFEDSFTLNGNPTLLPSNMFRPVQGTNGEWMYGLFEFPTTVIPEGSVAIVSNSEGSFLIGVNFGGSDIGAKFGYFSGYSTINLGPDRFLCTNGSLTLDAGYGQSSYLWNTGQTTQLITVSDTGNYWVTVNTGSCTASDTIHISHTPSAPPNLGPDRIACEGTPIILDGGEGFVQYNWSTGQNTRFITVTNSGNYNLEVTDLHGCQFNDSVLLQAQQSPTPIPIFHH